MHKKSSKDGYSAIVRLFGLFVLQGDLKEGRPVVCFWNLAWAYLARCST